MRERALDVRLQALVDERLVGRAVVGVREDVEQVVVVLVVERRVHREVARGVLERVADLLGLDVQLGRELVHVRRPLVELGEAGRRLADLRNRADAVERQAHDPALLGERLENGLADPPDGVRDELEARASRRTAARP